MTVTATTLHALAGLPDDIAGADVRLPIRGVWSSMTRTDHHGEPAAPRTPMAVGAVLVVPFSSDDAVVAARVRLHTFGTTTAEALLELIRLDGGEQVVAAERLHPVIDVVWYELRSSDPRPGGYALRITALAGTVAPAASMGDGTSPAWQLDTVDIQPARARVDDGTLVLEAHAPDAELTLALPWRREGYSVASDDVAFDTIVSAGGRYVPAQQLKRMPYWPFTVDDTDVAFVHGGTGFAVRSDASMSLSGTMSDDTMFVAVRTPGAVRVVPGVGLEPYVRVLPRFRCSQPRVGELLTRFYRERALSWPFQDYTASAVGWKHWLTRVLSWTATEGRDAQARDLAETTQDAEGWLWTRTDSAGWPFPDPRRYDTRHPSASLSFVTGVATHFSWTGDRAFLDAQWPRARRALAHILDAHRVAERGLLVDENADRDGQEGSLGTHYWDIVPGGATDAYANVMLYDALQHAARVEAHLDVTERARELESLAARVRERFTATFWDDAAGRFIQNVDATGCRHDYGASYLNLEALAAGLGGDSHVARVLEWLDTGSTELTERLLLDRPGGAAVAVPAGGELGRAFRVDSEFAQLAAVVLAHDLASAFTLRVTDASGAVLRERRFDRWWDRGWAPIDVGLLPAGDYRLTLTAHGEGLSWRLSDEQRLSLAVVSAHRPGPADIYDAWGFAPRASTRRNDFWYTFGWSGVETDYGDQVQDGGTALYISGFDIEARARASAELAWSRLVEILQRADEPDHLCGGSPLFRGEHPQAILPGQVGVDTPFPESGLVPAAALSAFLGLAPRPGGLVIRPRLPRDIDYLSVENLHWHGLRLEIRAEHARVTVRTPDTDLTAHYDAGEAVALRATASGRLQLHHLPEEEQR